MPRRTRPSDAETDELDGVVRDKRRGWRADPARGRRRHRRYARRLTGWVAEQADDDERREP